MKPTYNPYGNMEDSLNAMRTELVRRYGRLPVIRVNESLFMNVAGNKSFKDSYTVNIDFEKLSDDVFTSNRNEFKPVMGILYNAIYKLGHHHMPSVTSNINESFMNTPEAWDGLAGKIDGRNIVDVYVTVGY